VISRATWDCSECRRMSRTFCSSRTFRLSRRRQSELATRRPASRSSDENCGRRPALAAGWGASRSRLSRRWSADSWRSEAFDGRHGLAVENASVAYRLHAENADVLLQQIGQNSLLETFKMRIHDIEGHLNGVESKVMSRGCIKHLQVHVRDFVSRETEEACLAGFFSRPAGLDGTVGGEDTVGVIGITNFVDLKEVR